MKTRFWCVMSEFYDNGAVKAAITSGERRERPRDKERSFPLWTAFQDWFDTQREAESFLAEVKAMAIQGAA
jgi:hypothetical protein